MEFSQFDFQKNPYNTSNINIYPLSEDGIKKFSAKESFPRCYINKINPKLVREFEYEERLREREINHERENQAKGIFFNNELIGKK